MNNRMYLVEVIILTISLYSFSSFAQTCSVEYLTQRIHQKIAQLNDNIISMSNYNTDLSTRNHIMNVCINSLISEQNKLEDHVVPFIEYSVMGVRKKFRRTVDNYFQGLVNLRYRPVTIIGVRLLSSNNIYFDGNTSIVAAETLNLDELDKRNNLFILLPCTIFQADTHIYEHVGLYLMIEKTIDGYELIPQITSLYAYDIDYEN